MRHEWKKTRIDCKILVLNEGRSSEEDGGLSQWTTVHTVQAQLHEVDGRQEKISDNIVHLQYKSTNQSGSQ